MARIHLVRHGRAAAHWTEHPDPPLDDEGRRQAAAVAARLAPLGPLPVVTSPIRRARETAAAFEEVWGVEARVEPAVGEVRTPAGVGLDERGIWLEQFMSATWDGVAPDLVAWRDGVVAALLALDTDTVVVSHYVAINAAVGAATGSDATVCCSPGNCSVTVLDAGPSGLSVVEVGPDTVSEVL